MEREFSNRGRGGKESFLDWGETRSGTEKRCSHNLQSKYLRSEKQTGRGNNSIILKYILYI